VGNTAITFGDTQNDAVTIVANTAITDNEWNIAAAGTADFVSVGAGTPGTGAFTTLQANDDVTYTHADAETWAATSSDSDGSNYVTVANSAADVTGATWLLSLDYVDNDDTDADFLRLRDDSGGTPDTVFQVQEYGHTTIAGSAQGTDALTLTAGDILVTSGHIDITDGNFTMAEGEVSITSTDAGTRALTVSGTGAGEGLHVDDGTSLFDEEVTISADVILQSGGRIDNDSEDQITFDMEDATAVTIDATSSNATVDLTIDTKGAGSVTIGSADVTSFTVTTDSTGNAEVVLPNESIAAAEITNIVRTIQIPLYTWRTDADPPLLIEAGTTPNPAAEGNFDTIEWDTGENTQKITVTLTLPVADYASGLELHFITAHDGATDDDETVGLDWYNAKTGEADNPTVVDEGATAITYATTLNEGTIAMDGGTLEADDILRLVFGFDAIDETVHLVATWLEYTSTQ
jgi:hypothetical protein